MNRDSLRFIATLNAYRKGYRITAAGEVESAHKRIRRCRKHPFGHLTFTVKLKEHLHAIPISVHQLAALQKFGENALASSEQVRHLDGNPANNKLENIELGTHQDNCLDRLPNDRKTHGTRAASFLVREDWPLIDADRAKGWGYKKLAKKYLIATSTLSYRYGKGKRQSLRIAPATP